MDMGSLGLWVSDLLLIFPTMDCGILGQGAGTLHCTQAKRLRRSLGVVENIFEK